MGSGVCSNPNKFCNKFPETHFPNHSKSFVVPAARSRFHSRVLNDKLLQIFIELPKFADSIEELDLGSGNTRWNIVRERRASVTLLIVLSFAYNVGVALRVSLAVKFFIFTGEIIEYTMC